MLCAIPLQARAQTLGLLVHEMTADVAVGGDARIAVLEFAYADNKVSQGPAVVQERITTALARKRVGTVVERKLLDRVMGELRIQQAGMFDPATIKKIGKVLGADYVVIGTLNDVSRTRTEVNARLVDAETAEFIGASSAVIAKTWLDEPYQAKAAVPVSDDTKELIRTKAMMDNKLAELKMGIGTTIKPRPDGKLEVNGVVVGEEDFTKAVTKTMLNDVKEAGLKAPPMAEEGK